MFQRKTLHVTEFSFVQGGSKWHTIRAGMGYITSSVDSLFFELALDEINIMEETNYKFNLIASSLGIERKTITINKEFLRLMN